MPVVKLRTDKTLEERAFFQKISDRMQGSDLVKNPFKGRLDMVSTDRDLITVINLDPIYPDLIPKVGLFLAGVSAFFGWWFIMICGLCLGLTSVLWTDRFFFFLLKRARKKEGLKGSIKLLNNKEAWEEVFLTWDK
jgi:hypothetical protein